jgi:hypothetical protein
VPWAFASVSNPSVLLVHTTVELTDAIIETCPPGHAPAPLDRVLDLPDVRSIDLHRYRARLNLEPGVSAADVRWVASEPIEGVWGPEGELPPEELPRAFETEHEGSRTVAESPTMAGSHELARALFEVEGVSEVVAERHLVLVRLGRLFRWAEREPDVRAAIGRAS